MESLGRVGDPIQPFVELLENDPEAWMKLKIACEPKTVTVQTEPAPQLGDMAKRLLISTGGNPAKLLERLRNGRNGKP